MKKPVSGLAELARQAAAQKQNGEPTSVTPDPSFSYSQLDNLQAMSPSQDQISLAQSVREGGKSFITVPSSGRRVAVEYQFLSASEVARLCPSPYNIRDCETLNRADVDDIYDSIHNDGVVHPPFLLPVDGKLDVVDGWRRTYCLCEQKKGGTYGILRPDYPLTPAEIRSISMVSNIRVGNSLWEIGRFITEVQKESKKHLSERELASRCGQHLSTANLARRAYGIPLDVYRLFEGRTRIGRPAIVKILKLWDGLDPDQKLSVVERLQEAPQEMKASKAMVVLTSIVNEITGRQGKAHRGEKIGSYLVRQVTKKSIQIECGSEDEIAKIMAYLRQQAHQ